MTTKAGAKAEATSLGIDQEKSTASTPASASSQIARKSRYALGFIFSDDNSTVALLRKNRPAWQEGKLNGIGGHVEQGESFLAGMERESLEEVGLSLTWTPLARLEAASWEMIVYTTKMSLIDIANVRCIEDEIIELWPAKALPDYVIPNLRYLIPFALNKYTEDWMVVRGVS